MTHSRGFELRKIRAVVTRVVIPVAATRAVTREAIPAAGGEVIPTPEEGDPMGDNKTPDGTLQTIRK